MARRVAARGRTVIALALLGFVLIAAGVIWRRATGVAQLRALQALDQQRLRLEAERASLERDIRDASSRERLVPIAESRLGMHIPADTQVVILTRTGVAP
jgi:cell division protein FtsL